MANEGSCQLINSSLDELGNGVSFSFDVPLDATNDVSKTVSLFAVTNLNNAPTIVCPIADVSTSEDAPFSLMVPVGTFNDVDAGDSLTYSATLADGTPLPSWLSFDSELQGTLKYSITATNTYFSQSGKWPSTDSASAITAIITGEKTDDGNISWKRGDPANGKIKTIAETLRDDLGFAIGVASTVPFTHATPAGVVSHNINRNNYQDIAHEILFDTQPDVVIGGGLDSLFAKAVTNAAKASTDLDHNGYNDDYDAFKAGTAGTNHDNNGYTFVERATGLDGGTALAAAANTIHLADGDKLFGLFGTSGGNFEYYEVADTPGTVTITRSTTDSTPGVDEDPTMAEMTTAAISVLNQDNEGFFVMFEQGYIDWSNHAQDYENMVGGVVDLENAVTAAENMVTAGIDGMNWSNTLMIVTADHSTSYMRLQEELGKGNLPLQTVVAGKQTYAGGDVTYGTTGHTNELVTLQARGAGAELFKEYAGVLYPGTNIVDNTMIYEVMLSAAKDIGAEHIVLFIGDGMNIEHEIAGSQYLYGKDFGLTWHDWGQLEDGWTGYASTWDVSSYNTYAQGAGVASYNESTFDPLIGYDPSKGGETPLPTGVRFSGTPTNDGVGLLDIKVTATDESGSASSDIFTLTVTNTNDSPTGSVLINGTSINGRTLTATNTLQDADGLGSISYQWQAGGVNIGGATGESFVLSEAEVGKAMTVVASYTDGHNTYESVSSAMTAAVTADTIAPTITMFSPADETTGVAVGSDFVLTFSEDVQKGTGMIEIHSDSATGAVLESYNVATDTTHLTFSGSELAIHPTHDLSNATHYFVTFAEGSLKDLAGNHFAGIDTYDFTTAATCISGAVTFWKTGAPIADVVSTLASVPAASGTQPVEFRNIQVTADGSRTIEIWETSAHADTNSLQLELALPAGSVAAWQDAAGLPSGWISFPNTGIAGQFILAGIGITALSAGSIKLGTLTLTAPTNPEHFDLSLSCGQLGDDTIAAFGISSDSMTTGFDGLYHHIDIADGIYALISAKVCGTAEGNAVRANDALAALKIAVGMNPDSDGAVISPYQYLAADVNKDGQVKAADALNILKMAVKLDTAPANEWLFVPESVGSESMTRNSVIWPDNPTSVTLDHDLELNLIGIVKGDVDGSWGS